MPYFGYGFDILYLIAISPALLLMAWAQMRIRSTYAEGMRQPASMSGAQAAWEILKHGGCENVGIEEVEGHLSDHYDPTHRVLRLSSEVYHSRSLAAVGIAAHEAGHALQHAHHYTPLVIRNFAVPAAQWGPNLSIILFIIGGLMHSRELIIFGLIAFGGIVFFQLVNLPVEFDASNRAKQLLEQLGIVDRQGAPVVRSVLNAAAWTYVAGTLQSVLTLLYYVFRFLPILMDGGSRRRDD